MKITLAIPTNADWRRLNKTRQSIVSNTFTPMDVNIVIVDNGNTFGHDLTQWVNELQADYRGTVKLEVMPKRAGLTTAWKCCTDTSNTEWTVIINDDTYLMPAWDETFRQLLNKEPGHGCYLLCHPYNWSGFAVSRDFIQEFPWRTEFPEGYHEDDDLYLRVAQARGFTTKSEVYTKAIYCLPFATGLTQYCFTHSSDNAESKKSEYYTRWNQQANARVFHKYWRRVAAGTPGAIENKNGQYFKAV